MDEVDEAIARMLEVDGRLAHRDIAQAVALSRSAVAARVQRLLSSGQVLIRGVVHPAVLGLTSLAYVGIDVRGPAAAVAERVAARDDSPFVSLSTGRYAVLVELRATSIAAVDRAVGELRSMTGVHGVDTLSYVEVIRDVVGPVGVVDVQVDQTDLALLRILQRNGRASFVQLAQDVATSPAVARRRVLRLIENKVVRIGALVRQSGSDRQAGMGIGIRLAGDLDDILGALTSEPSVTFVARTLGRFDLLTSVRAHTAAQLLRTLDHVRSLSGVTDVESWVHLRVVKENYALESL